jgi:hypothetical protein
MPDKDLSVTQLQSEIRTVKAWVEPSIEVHRIEELTMGGTTRSDDGGGGSS